MFSERSSCLEDSSHSDTVRCEDLYVLTRKRKVQVSKARRVTPCSSVRYHLQSITALARRKDSFRSPTEVRITTAVPHTAARTTASISQPFGISAKIDLLQSPPWSFPQQVQLRARLDNFVVYQTLHY
jgi:hypothetical protein